MIKAQVLPVFPGEAEEIAAIIRQADIDEIVDALEIPIIYAVRLALTRSMKASKIVVDGKIVAVFGDAEHDEDIGVPWLFSTIHVGSHARAFLEVCKPEVQEMLTRRPKLFNYVDVRNRSAIRWLKWLGFDFGEPIPYGPKGLLFAPFTMIRG